LEKKNRRWQMKKWSRRLIWGTIFFAILAVVAFAAGYIGRNFIGLGPVPTRSAFAGRLPGMPEGDMRRFRFFYATNRMNRSDSFNERGNLLGKEISTGTYDVLISPYLPIEPFAWFDHTSMKWAGRQELSREDFRLQLHAAVKASPQKSILIIVWGFRDWFQSAALKTAYSAYILDIDTPVLLFDWPGNQGEGRRGYAAAQLASAESAPHLGAILAEVVKSTDAEKVWLMGSSLGCQTICDALAWLALQPDLFKGKPKLSHVVFSAPDVSAQAFDDKFAENIQLLSEHLTTYVSSNDQALLMSHWINGNRRLGRVAGITVPPEERGGEYEFEEAMELLELQMKGAKNFSVIDATPVNRTRNLHHFFTDSPEFFDDLYQHLLEPDHVVSRRLHEVRAGPLGTTYWILWNF
jgi:esterase/lipase superfamily enzyme